MAELNDILVVYPSEDDSGLFVAHSIRTDQVGIGDSPAQAIAELCLAMRDLLEAAASNPDVRIEQLAPTEVVKRLTGATHLPEAVMHEVRELLQEQHNPSNQTDPFRRVVHAIKKRISGGPSTPMWHDISNGDLQPC